MISNSSYISALLITIAVELVIVLVITRPKVNSALAIIVINIISHPWAVISNIYINGNIYGIELLVIMVETVLWKLVTKWKWYKCLALAVITNVCSALLGILLVGLIGK